MPTYLYRCNSGHTAEIIRPVAERDTPTTCGVCRAEMKRNFDFASVEFKGSGFYRTDKNG